jgi:hypothetical protein
MKLSEVARLAEAGAIRIYQTKSIKPMHVLVVSAEVNYEGRLFITVANANEPTRTFNVSAFSLSLPTEGA